MDLELIEQQRRQLEAQVASLRDSLRHWQTWDAEYEGLKEELSSSSLRHSLDENTLAKLSKSYNGSLVNEKEIRDLAGLSSASPRTLRQINDLIDHRLGYVAKNIDTLSRQYYVAEGKLEEFDFAHALATGADPRFGDDHAEDGSPLIEIHEELDEDDNVITSELRRPDIETQTLLDKIAAKQTMNKPAASSTSTESKVLDSHHRPAVRKKSVSFSADTKAAEQRDSTESADGKKSVSFAPKVAVAPAAALPDNRTVSFASDVEEIPPNTVEQSPAAKVTEKAVIETQQQLKSSFKPGDTVYELSHDEEPAKRHIVLPDSESPQDAEMRRQMLNYHLNEVGSVVASMDLDEGDGYNDDHSDFASSENLDDLDTPYTTGTSDDEDEDDHGRLKGSGISNDYRAQMSALSARLMAPAATSDSQTDTQTLAIRRGRSSLSNVSDGQENAERPQSKKRVSFAEVLDVATDEAPPAKIYKAAPDSPHPAKSAGFTVSSDSVPVDTFDADGPDSDNEGGPIVSEVLVERPSKQSSALPPSTEDADLLMSRRELATEYHRKRNEMIREQGGFNSNADADEQLYEERDGKVKKVSRFKAARLQ